MLKDQGSLWPADLVVVARHDSDRRDRIAVGRATQLLLEELPASMLIVPATEISEPAEACQGETFKVAS